MVEKSTEYAVGKARLYFKYRVGFQGNNATDQDCTVALFTEMATTPAALDTSGDVDMYGCLKGHSILARDVQPAYLDATLQRTPTYVVLPTELWDDRM